MSCIDRILKGSAIRKFSDAGQDLSFAEQDITL